jgi:hypothetical protein
MMGRLETDLEELRAAVSTGYARGTLFEAAKTRRAIGRIGTTEARGAWKSRWLRLLDIDLGVCRSGPTMSALGARSDIPQPPRLVGS